MKTLLTLLTCLFILSPNVVLSETIYDLVKRNGLQYQKYSDVPFSGKVSGTHQGKFRNGKREGAWVVYWENGTVDKKYTGTYKNDKRDGAWIYYNYDGQLSAKGNFKNGKEEGAWEFYNDDGTVNKKLTGTYKDGKKISD